MLHFSSPFCWQLIHALELLPKVRLLAWYLPLPVPRWYWTRKQARLAKAMRTSSTYDEWRGGQTYDSAYGCSFSSYPCLVLLNPSIFFPSLLLCLFVCFCVSCSALGLAEAMDELHGRTKWKESPEDPRYHCRLVKTATQRLRLARLRRK